MSARKDKSKADQQAQGAIEFRNQYDAGGHGRRMRGWKAPNTGPNRAVQALPTIRARSRDAGRNDWTAASGLQHWTTNLIGTGIVPRAKRITDKAKKKAYADLWDAWIKQSDADGVLNFYGQQTLATRAWLESGEVFARLRYRSPSSGMDVPMQVQLIESDFVPMLDSDYWPGMVPNNRIRQGIELNSIGQRVAYWVYREHPTDFVAMMNDLSKLIRVPVSEMIHVFEPKRPGQLRGVPDFAPVLARLRNVSDFDDAVLERQKLANLFTVFIKKILPQNWDGTDPMTGQAIQYDADGTPIAALQPGASQELLPGEEIQFSNPPEAGTTYAEYMRSQNLGTAAGQGLPYETMSGDIQNISDRTLRIIVTEFRRYAEQRQWQIVIPMLCQKVRDAWVDQAILMGGVDQADRIDMQLVEWSPQGWEYIHPVQDVQGKKLAVDAGFRSRSSVIAERGDDPEAVDEERAADQARAKELDLLPPVPIDPNAAKPVDPQKKQQALAEIERINAETHLLAAQADAAGSAAAANAEKARTYAEAQVAMAETARAEAEYHTARAGQARADATLAEAHVARIQAEATLAQIDSEHRAALASQESTAVIEGCEARTADARREVDARIAAVTHAEMFAVEQRELMREAERARTATAQLELRAAEVGLAELQEP